jgi:hypothetical protein
VEPTTSEDLGRDRIVASIRDPGVKLVGNEDDWPSLNEPESVGKMLENTSSVSAIQVYKK